MDASAEAPLFIMTKTAVRKTVEWFDDIKETRTHMDDGSVWLDIQQDITKLLDQNKAMQNATSSWRKFDPKKEYHQVLDLSMVDVMRLKTEHGVDVLAPETDWKYVFKLIRLHYPYMMTTTARLD